MTREEAIAAVKEVAGMSLPWNDRHYEALQMAIKALEQQPCEDTISRQAVIDAINKAFERAIRTAGSKGNRIYRMCKCDAENVDRQRADRWRI